MHTHAPVLRFRFYWAFLHVIAIGLASTANAAAPKFNSEKLAAIGPAMQHFVDSQEIPGTVMVVGTSDGVVYHEAIGNQRLDAAKPMAKNSLFRIASMTKPITAIGIMMLVDEGKLSIDDPVEKHLPEFKGQMLVAAQDDQTTTLKKPSRPITVRDLLTHTSGLPGSYPKGLSDLSGKRNRTLAEGAIFMSQQPLEFEPGSKWKYCSTGIDVLGRIIEVASGQSYEDFLMQRVFQPLGMHDTSFYPSPEQRERLAQICAVKDGKLVAASPDRVPAEKPKNPNPSGGLYSTGADLARLYQMLLRDGELDGHRILSKAAVKNMTEVHTGDLKCGFSEGLGYGLGVGVVREPQEVTESLSPGAYGHGGAYGTQGWIDPNKDLYVVLLIQRTGLKPNGDRSEMRRQLQNLAVKAIEP